MRTKEEILETKNWSMEYPNFMQESEIHDAMDEYAKEVAIDFFKWNVMKVDEYVSYLNGVNRAEGLTEKHKESDNFECATISGRFDLYQQEKSSLK